MSAIPTDFTWHQSSVATMLRCPESFRLRYVARVQADHRATDYAAQLGTADHVGAEFILHCVNEGREVERGELLSRVMEGFEGAVHRSQGKGAIFDSDGIDRALERLEGERLDRLLLLAEDPRIRAIDWLGVEWKFDFTERGGRRWRGILDAWGVAREDVEEFGKLGRDPVILRRGDGVICDWKTGESPPFGFVERVRNVQLGIYAMALGRELRARGDEPRRWRTFLGLIKDLDRPKAPTDDQGKRIPKRLPKALNPAFVVATNLDPDAAKKSKKRPRDADGEQITKWLPEQLNPSWEYAVARPKGPVFREARVDFSLVLETARFAIRQAELGLFPASGALSGQCGRCSYATICTATNQEQDDNDHNHA